MEVILRTILPVWMALFAQAGGPRPATVELFTPQGTVKEVRQVQVRFSDQMVPFGDPRASVEPFEISCGEKGKSRWVDGRNWVFDFERDLPAGVRCLFTLKSGLKTLEGRELSGERSFSFSTGGPAILNSSPYQGAGGIDENQVFILELDAEPREESVLSNVWFEIQGLEEKIGIKIIKGAERDALIKAEYAWRSAGELESLNLVLIQARRVFPQSTRVDLVWGEGVASESGVRTESNQVLPFTTRPPFTATFECQRENAEAECVPLTPMRLSFSAPVLWSKASAISLTGPGGKKWSAKDDNGDPEQEEEVEGGNRPPRFVNGVRFTGPFPEKSSFRIALPAGVQDDAGRKLSNQDRFPLTVQTDHYPPLAKFGARFGILELNGEPVLPVTVRNLEAQIKTVMSRAEPAAAEGRPGQTLPGNVLRVPGGEINQIRFWLERVTNSWQYVEKSVFGGVAVGNLTRLAIPKPNGPSAFEVIGIPLKQPGFYVVELQSEALGAALLGKKAPMYVQTAALVTNLSVHFKWGIESSLVWVTALDTGRPVPGCSVEISDKDGAPLWTGLTDANGVARVLKQLPASGYVYQALVGNGLYVTARLKDDMAFVYSGWCEGIERWRFNVESEGDDTLTAASTVLDRSLLRAGDTLHMKHVLRKHITTGFAQYPQADRPKRLVVRHGGSEQEYELPVTWDSTGIAENEWDIPRNAKLGFYNVILRGEKKGEESPQEWTTSTFRVEEFRVPLLRASLQFPKDPLVAPSQIPVDLSVQYLAGGGASRLPVKLRYRVEKGWGTSFTDFEGFQFGNGKVAEGLERDSERQDAEPQARISRLDLTLEKTGTARAALSELPPVKELSRLIAELDFQDPNGETQTVDSRVPLWPAAAVAGLKIQNWTGADKDLKLQAAVVGVNGKPIAGQTVQVDLFQRKTYSHRKRLVGGFYAYEHSSEVKRVGLACEGVTDAKGLLSCAITPSVSGEIILQARVADSAGRESYAQQTAWFGRQARWWFAVEDHDRIDLLPEKKKYEPGQTAKFQVRMPFEKATALITVEREGIADVFVREILGTSPIIEIPVKTNYGPNVYVSVLLVRGRVAAPKPTAMVDLARPAYKMGLAEISVGRSAYELKVDVKADRQVYRAREKAKLQLAVRTPDGKAPPAGTEVAVAAVDEGLLELMQNDTWNLLDSMLGHRGYGVQTSTAQMHVVGKRHFGLKALPTGGGGGKQPTRELFDTLLLWKGRVKLDPAGNAVVEVPLNDSITSFTIAAVANGGVHRFGTGKTSIRSIQELSMFSGLAPVVRGGDKALGQFTVRNATDKPMPVNVSGRVRETNSSLAPQQLSLGPGEAKEVSWTVSVPPGVPALHYELEATSGVLSDRLSVVQKVMEAVPVQVYQATLFQLENQFRTEVQIPADALPGRGGVNVSFAASLVDGLDGVYRYMRGYPYTCLEQKVSRAVALRDQAMWESIAAELPSYVDPDGLLKYFPDMALGSDCLTAYFMSVTQEAQFSIPESTRNRILTGLKGFANGSVVRWSTMPTTDLALRKMAAVEALSRYNQADPAVLSTIAIEPNLWPTSGVIDWFNVLNREQKLPRRAERLAQTEQILRSRLNFQGTVMTFSTASRDVLWWLMVSEDTNAARLLLSLLEFTSWNDDMGRVVRGALSRMRGGHWDLTTANAWGVLAMDKFSKTYEKTPVAGTSRATLDAAAQTLDWAKSAKGDTLALGWPARKAAVEIAHTGSGRPWVTLQSLAAIPLKSPLSSGYKITKTITPVEQQKPAQWTRGDIFRVRLELEAQTDMTWVVVSDPIPSGSAILGTGLGRDSSLATSGEKAGDWWTWPAFEERSFEAFRAYYEYIPKGSWSVEYTFRVNNPGEFNLPTTRVEALYSPEMFGEMPNEPVTVK